MFERWEKQSREEGKIMFERWYKQSSEEQKMVKNNPSPWEAILDIFCKWLADEESMMNSSELQDHRGATLPFKPPTRLVYDPKKQGRAFYGVGG